MSAAAKRHLAEIHELACVVHWNCYGQRRTADEAHHLEFVRGEHSDFATVPVCAPCHDELHESRRRAFYRAHKLDDVKLLAWTIQALQAHHELSRRFAA
ncbi:MAG TPA: hypothetical protein VF516_03380 [Kofleriaceae bacterium]